MIANLMGGDGLYVIIIALVVLVGGSQLPKIARNIGLAGKEFRNAQAEADAENAAKKAAGAQATPVPPVELPATPAPVPAPPVAAATPPAGDAEASISLTPAQLDALLKAREEQVRGEATSN
ncbi:MAG TPA: twin-arginine translocase TatA/TatE family subunit [Acidimicrobiales bacterium]|jgi:Sec-independent protein translocase protein TatA|nr:twin-arginine translocase TatA/TatE family subunit [Acidimicrobiales bacterium]